MTDAIIILDVIIERASDHQIAQLCSGISTSYFATNAAAQNTYTFGWDAFGNLSSPVKLTVGTSGLLLSYNGSTQRVEAIGTCDNGVFSGLSVNNGTSLQYSNNGFTFTVQFHLVDGASIEISVVPASNTTITAAS